MFIQSETHGGPSHSFCLFIKCSCFLLIRLILSPGSKWWISVAVFLLLYFPGSFYTPASTTREIKRPPPADGKQWTRRFVNIATLWFFKSMMIPFPPTCQPCFRVSLWFRFQRQWQFDVPNCSGDGPLVTLPRHLLWRHRPRTEWRGYITAWTGQRGGGQPQQNEAIDRSCKDRTSTRPSRGGGGGKWGFSPCAQGMPFTPCANPGRDGPAHQLRFIEGVIKVNMNIRVEFHHSRWLVICIFYKLPPVNSSRLTVRKYTLSCIHALLDCTWKARHDPCRQ